MINDLYQGIIVVNHRLVGPIEFYFSPSSSDVYQKHVEDGQIGDDEILSFVWLNNPTDYESARISGSRLRLFGECD